ncbi:MAG: hypothetical protein D6711_17520 [Chloroflexi bacterium]|nr:MAG: hypothetical protein D6711_17520 [Chloroflexota bacterium]
MPQVKIHLELNVPVEQVTVNEIIVLFQQILTQLVIQLVAGWLSAWQEAILDRWLGERQQPCSATEVPWACPGCHSRSGFSRRGWRPRVLRQTSLGRIPFQLRQVTCQRCGKTFAPLQASLGLAPYQVSTMEFRERAVTAVCQVSYRRGAEWVSTTPLSAPVSAAAVHKWVQATGQAVEFTAEATEQRPLLLDGTQVNAGENQRGVGLHLGIAITGRRTESCRPQLEKQVVAFTVAEDWRTTLTPLRGTTPERIVFDGETELANLIEYHWPTRPHQRCLWHLVANLYPALWKDGLSKADVKPIQERLAKLLYEMPQPQAQAAYDALQDEFCLLGLENGRRYLQKARPDVFTFQKQPAGEWNNRKWHPASQAIVATSPLEREMREINRRTDNGSRWGVPGVQHLVGLDLVRRFDATQ